MPSIKHSHFDYAVGTSQHINIFYNENFRNMGLDHENWSHRYCTSITGTLVTLYFKWLYCEKFVNFDLRKILISTIPSLSIETNLYLKGLTFK